MQIFLRRKEGRMKAKEFWRTDCASVRRVFGPDSREYCMMLASRADFAHNTSGEGDRAIEMYKSCLPYIESHPWDISMKKYLLTDYAATLFDAGRYRRHWRLLIL